MQSRRACRRFSRSCTPRAGGVVKIGPHRHVVPSATLEHGLRRRIRLVSPTISSGYLDRHQATRRRARPDNRDVDTALRSSSSSVTFWLLAQSGPGGRCSQWGMVAARNTPSRSGIQHADDVIHGILVHRTRLCVPLIFGRRLWQVGAASIAMSMRAPSLRASACPSKIE
jgi:hypothetical protein